MRANSAESGRGKSVGRDRRTHVERERVGFRKCQEVSGWNVGAFRRREDRQGIMSMSHRHNSGTDHGRHSVTAAVFGIDVGIHQESDVHALHAPVLVLNASYEPINVCAARRAIVLVLKGVAMTEEENGHFLHAARLALRVPSVIRLLEYRRIPHQTRAFRERTF